MNYRIHVSDKALANVESVVLWFPNQSASAVGQRWFDALWNTLDTLEARPERCSLADESNEIGIEVRELLFGRKRGQYRILFRVVGKTVHILRIWHSARDRFTVEDL